MKVLKQLWRAAPATAMPPWALELTPGKHYILLYDRNVIPKMAMTACAEELKQQGILATCIGVEDPCRDVGVLFIEKENQ